MGPDFRGLTAKLRAENGSLTHSLTLRLFKNDYDNIFLEHDGLTLTNDYPTIPSPSSFKLVILIKTGVIQIKSFTLKGQAQLFLARESPLSYVAGVECKQTRDKILVEFIPNLDFLKHSEANESYRSQNRDNKTPALKGVYQQPFFHLLPLSILNNYKTPSALANQLVVMTPVHNGPLWCQGGRGCRRLV